MGFWSEDNRMSDTKKNFSLTRELQKLVSKSSKSLLVIELEIVSCNVVLHSQLYLRHIALFFVALQIYHLILMAVFTGSDKCTAPERQLVLQLLPLWSFHPHAFCTTHSSCRSRRGQPGTRNDFVRFWEYLWNLWRSGQPKSVVSLGHGDTTRAPALQQHLSVYCTCSFLWHLWQKTCRKQKWTAPGSRDVTMTPGSLAAQ